MSTAEIFRQTLAMGGAPMPGQEPPDGEGRSPYRRPLHEMTESELVKANDAWFDRSTAARRHVERQALLAAAFLLDQHYVEFLGSHQGARLVQTPPKKGRVRTVEQIIEPAYRGELARLLRTRPRGIVLPEGTDPQDYEAASAADQVLTHIQRESDFETSLEEAVAWQVAAGNALFATHWDPNGRDRDGNQGVIAYRALGPFEFAVPQPQTPHLEDQPYIMITKRFELDDIEDRWGVRVSADEHGSYGSLDTRLAAVVQGGTRAGNAHTEVREAVVKETWIKPSPIAPEGAVLITAGGQLLDMAVWPTWCEGRYPFTHLVFTSIPGSFWGKGLVQSLIPLQRRHNRAASTNIELLNMLSQISIAVPRNTQVRQILGGRAAMFEMPPGATQPVTNITPPPLGDLAYRELEHTRMAVRDISYQHEVSKGYTPPNVRSGTAISMLKEIDDSASSLPLRRIERATERSGQITLAIVKQYWNEPRLIRVLGDSGDLERISFIGSGDIGGHYVVQPGSAWPYTRAEKQGLILQLYDRQLISPDEALQYVDMGGTASELRQQRDIDKRHARRENQKFEALTTTVGADGKIVWAGEVPMPEYWHNHLVHLAVHQEIRKSPQYERWPIHRKQAFEAHIIGHMAGMYAQMQGQMGMPSQGPPPTAPPPQAAGPAGPAEEAAQANDSRFSEEEAF